MKKSTCLVYIILTIVTISAIITLNPANAVISHPITVNITPTSGQAPLAVNLSVDTGGVSYKSIEWNFGDTTPHDTSNKTTLSHTYQSSGNFTGSVDVTFRDLTSSSQSFYVNVGAAAPTAVSSSNINNQTTAQQILANSQNGSPLGATLPMTVVTDQPSYNQGDTVLIKGTIRDIQNQTAIAVIVRDPLKNLVSIAQPPLSSTGTFTITLKANGPLWKQAGNYTVIAQ